jgi:hypothetical protein
VSRKCNFFLWLAILGRCWTSECLERHGSQSEGPCAFCVQADETIDHLFVGCAYSREIWFKILCPCDWQSRSSTLNDQLLGWWLNARKRVSKVSNVTAGHLIELVSQLMV